MKRTLIKAGAGISALATSALVLDLLAFHALPTVIGWWATIFFLLVAYDLFSRLRKT